MSGFRIELSRRLARARRRSVWLRQRLPYRVIHLANKARSLASQARRFHTPIEYSSSSVNVYHCCTVKTGSQWIQALLSDLATYKYSGLGHYNYLSRMYPGRDPRPKMGDRWFTEPFPEKTIVSPMYIDYPCFAGIPKPDRYKAFFVMRDPRDIVVSWYYSSRYSHLVLGEDIRRVRESLERVSVSEGLLQSIDLLADYGLFDSLRAWSSAPERDPNVLVVRFEDLVSARQPEVMSQLFSHLDIEFPPEELQALLDGHSFAKVSGGRRQGSEDKRSHIRKGTGGDWKRLFDDPVTSRLEKRAGDLPRELGYG